MCENNFCVDFGYHSTKSNLKTFEAEFNGKSNQFYYNSWMNLYTIKGQEKFFAVILTN